MAYVLPIGKRVGKEDRRLGSSSVAGRWQDWLVKLLGDSSNKLATCSIIEDAKEPLTVHRHPSNQCADP